jgi:hypothetical protein
VAISFLSSILPWLIGRLLLAGAGLAAAVAEPLELQSRRELFVDGYLIERLDGAQLKLGQPVDEGSVLTFDLPWEVPFAGATSILQDGDVYRLYYRGANVDAQGEYDESGEPRRHPLDKAHTRPSRLSRQQGEQYRHATKQSVTGLTQFRRIS